VCKDGNPNTNQGILRVTRVREDYYTAHISLSLSVMGEWDDGGWARRGVG
jgi:hypothetical protein